MRRAPERESGGEMNMLMPGQGAGSVRVAHACRKRRAAPAQRSAADRPQVTQYFQPRSSSLPHAGQCTMVRSWPQCGQNWMWRPAGKSPLQKPQ